MLAGTRPKQIKSQLTVQTAASSSDHSTRKRKQAAATDSHAAPTAAQENHGTAAQVQAPARKKPLKAAVALKARRTQPESAALADKRKAGQAASPAKNKKAARSEGAPLLEDAPGGSEDVNTADSMPGIPGAGAAEKTWRELNKRADVKRGRFSQTEKETLLEAIKV
jgi:hypothetical protein